MCRTIYRIFCSLKLVLEAIFHNFLWKFRLCFKKYIYPISVKLPSVKSHVVYFLTIFFFLEKNLKYSWNLTLRAWPTSCHITFLKKKPIVFNIFLQIVCASNFTETGTFYIAKCNLTCQWFSWCQESYFKERLAWCQRTVRTYVYVISSKFHVFPINKRKEVEFSINPLVVN